MHISTFQDLLTLARQQPIPQRLLCLFAKAELPPDASPSQQADFDAGQGGFLTPLMGVDKAPEDISTFTQLVAEADHVSPHWHLVFVAALQNPHGQPIDAAMVDQALADMTEAVHQGQVGAFIPFNRQGDAVHLQ
jgi:hypothetical protein